VPLTDQAAAALIMPTNFYAINLIAMQGGVIKMARLACHE
jgi:hypothetical protein